MARIVASGILLALAVTMNACALALPAEIAGRGGASGGHPHEAGGGARTAAAHARAPAPQRNPCTRRLVPTEPGGGWAEGARAAGPAPGRTRRLITNM
jgi:hypothetical protein